MSETKKCKDCQLDIPKKAKRCPSCTADQRSWATRNPIKTILLVLIGIPIFISFLSGVYQDERYDTSTSQIATDNTIEEPNWSYSTEIDELTDEKQYFATTISTNELIFDFPYSGGTAFQLMIRDLNKGKGEEVLIVTDNAQFLTFDETIKVRFDDGEAITYGISGSDSGGAEVVFINRASSFISKLKNSSEIRVEAPFYDTGRKVIYFDTSDYKGLQK